MKRTMAYFAVAAGAVITVVGIQILLGKRP